MVVFKSLSRLFLYFGLLEVIGSGSGSIPPGHRLADKIFENYNRNIRPMNNFSQYLLVTINPVLNSLESVNEPQELITINYWFNLEWADDRLKWNSSEMDGLDIIQIPSRMLWIPDVVVDSIISLTEIPASENIFCRLFSTGKVSCVFNQVVETHCRMEVSLFPFDRQNCTIVYYSWSYGADRVRLQTRNPEGDVQYFKNNTEWELIEFSNLVFLKQYTTSLFSEVHYYLIIRRKPLYYVVTLVLPSFLITTLAVIGLFAPFNAAGDREEKVSMGLTTLLTMAVLLLVISEQMPKTSNKQPMIGLYMIAQIVLSSVATSLTVVVMHFHRYALHGRPVPHWLLVVSCLSCGPEKKDQCSSAVRFGSSKGDRKLLKNLQVVNDLFKDNPSALNLNLPVLLQQCLSQVISIRSILDQKQSEHEFYVTWIRVCDRLDLILMIIFIAFNLIFTLIVFASGLAQY